MTLLKAQVIVACPWTGRDIEINSQDGCWSCQFFGPVSYVGITRVYVACRYGEPAADKAGPARSPAATGRDPAGQAEGLAKY
jgi:hypothetical protein